jgi:uridine phosphorylase
MITPQQTLSAARSAGLRDDDLRVDGFAVLTFNKAIVERMEELCALKEIQWLAPQHHPYAACHAAKQGVYQGRRVTVLVPPMGASPLSCIVEDLVVCGAKAIFLACAAWSLGRPIQFGDLIIPSFSVGSDGTSIHYGNTKARVSADTRVVEALQQASRARGVTVHVGGNATCEALYRITPEMVEAFREQGCLCMENGEAATLFAVTQALDVPSGALFQPYIDLTKGWDPNRFDERYWEACRLQAEIVLEAGSRLNKQDLVKERKDTSKVDKGGRE